MVSANAAIAIDTDAIAECVAAAVAGGECCWGMRGKEEKEGGGDEIWVKQLHRLSWFVLDLDLDLDLGKVKMKVKNIDVMRRNGEG